MLKFLFKTAFLVLSFLLSYEGFSQTIITGKVKEQNGSPLIGASIQVMGTNTGVITDVNGNYKIETSKMPPFKLIVSFVGYTSQNIEIGKSISNVVVTLDEVSSNMEEIVVSASRKAEKVQDAPASVSVISAKTLQAASSAIDPIRELINVPGVQIQQQSASRMNIEMRGASSLFSTSVFPILDYRSLVGAGTGAFQSDASGINSIDLARIEVVRGPGSALYGPGVTAGVVHFITKNPIDYTGTTVELIGGELGTFGGSIRHAVASKNKKIGFKINAHYKKGNEFTLNPNNSVDSLQISKFSKQIINPIINGLGVVSADQTGAEVLLNQQKLDPDGDGNMMSNNWWNTAVNATLELRPKTDTRIFLSGGFNQSHAVFYNEQGEGLTQNKEYWTQARLQKGGLFAQVFYINNDGGKKNNPTFLYQTGNRTPLARKQIEGQVQYNFNVPKFLNADFTVGADYRSVINETEHMVYGRNEDNDDYRIMGTYAQGKFALAQKLDFVLAGRYDRFNFINDGAFSPRAALVYKTSKDQTFRMSFNRAFAPPPALDLYIDFPIATPAAGLFDIWYRGSKNEQKFAANPMIKFTAGFPEVPYGTAGLPLAIPYGAVTPDILAGLSQALPANIYSIVQTILTNPANAPSGTSGTFTSYNLFTGQPLTPTNVPKAQLRQENTFEIGYKGTFNNKFSLSVWCTPLVGQNS